MNPSIRRVLEAVESGDYAYAAKQATLMLTAYRRHKRVVATKRAPRRKVERADKEARREAWQRTREAVLARSGGCCELCCTPLAVDAHHLMTGPLRRKYETPACVVSLCRHCHDLAHDNDAVTLCALSMLAVTLGAPDIVAATVNRRSQKVQTALPPPPPHPEVDRE